MLTYTSTKWVNGSGSPLNATNLNNIETGIDALVVAVNTHEGTLDSHSTEIGKLKTADAENAAEIASNKTNITTLTNDLTTTKTTVSNHETRVDVLETKVGDATTGLVKRVATLENSSATKGELLAVKTELTEDITAVDEGLKARIATAEQDILALQSGSGGSGGASTWEDVSGKPNAFNPTSHANGDSSVYGAATTSLYGHVKISNGDVANTASANGLAAGMDHSHSDYATKTEATQETSGLFSAADKTKLDGIATGADKTVIVNDLITDSDTAALSAAQGKALKTAIDSLTSDLGELGGGDMLKASYDTDNNGSVDNADNAVKFDGHAISEFSMNGHKHEISNVNNLQTELDNKADIEHTHDHDYADIEHTHDYADKAFKSVEVSGTTITADNHQDTLVIAAGSNITLTPDATNDKITIAAKDTTYTFTNKAATLAWGTTSTIATVGGTDITVKMPSNPDTDAKTTSGNTSSKIYLVGATSQSASAVTTYSHDTAYVGTDGCLYSNNTKVSVDGHTHSQYLTEHQTVSNSAPTLLWGATSTVGTIGGTALTITMPENPDTDTTYSAGAGISLSGTTFSNSGVRSISASSHRLTVNTGGKTATFDLSYSAAGTDLGLVKSGGDVTISSGTITVNDDSHNHTIANVDNLQDTLTTLTNMLTWKGL